MNRTETVSVSAIRRLASRGLMDREIAERLALPMTTVTYHRMKNDIPSGRNSLPPRKRAKFLEAVKRRARDWRDRQRAELAGQRRLYGLPGDLKTAELRILLALTDGPATKDVLRARTGLKTFNGRNLPLTNLTRRGLIVSVSHYTGGGPGTTRKLFMLTLKTLEMLTRENDRDQTELAADHAVGGGADEPPAVSPASQGGRPGKRGQRGGV